MHQVDVSDYDRRTTSCRVLQLVMGESVYFAAGNRSEYPRSFSLGASPANGCFGAEVAVLHPSTDWRGLG